MVVTSSKNLCKIQHRGTAKRHARAPKILLPPLGIKVSPLGYGDNRNSRLTQLGFPATRWRRRVRGGVRSSICPARARTFPRIPQDTVSRSGLSDSNVESRWLSSYGGMLPNRADITPRPSVAFYLGPPSLEKEMRGPL
jgi:hypothetical protein